jgi:hypothetical protein
VRLTRSRLTALAGVAIGALVLGVAPAASAAPDLAGIWASSSLKNGGPGYILVVTAADSGPANAYNVVVRYRPAGANAEKRVKAGMTQKGREASLLVNGKGGLADASNANIMKGTIGKDGSVFFPTCLEQFPKVGKGTASEVCLFQRATKGMVLIGL